MNGLNAGRKTDEEDSCRSGQAKATAAISTSQRPACRNRLRFVCSRVETGVGITG
jgi:hypothetical protein